MSLAMSFGETYDFGWYATICIGLAPQTDKVAL